MPVKSALAVSLEKGFTDTFGMGAARRLTCYSEALSSASFPVSPWPSAP